MKELDDKKLITITQGYKHEAEQARSDRMQKNKINFDMYHMRQDFDYKIKGQSREFLPKASMAVEQSANFLQQGLTDLGEWFNVLPEEGVEPDALKIKPSEVKLMLQRHLEKDNFLANFGDMLKTGLLGSLMIAKVHGKEVPKPKYQVKEVLRGSTFSRRIVKTEDKEWQLKISLVRAEDFYPDPTGRGLYLLEDIYMDYYQLEQLATGPGALYDLEEVKKLKGMTGSTNTIRDYNKSRETDQNTSNTGTRKQIKITECWGNIVDETGALVQENVMWTIAEDTYLIQKPIENPLWHQEHPYVFAPIITVPNSVWSRALMDAPSAINKAINEMFNLILDGGLMGVHGIKQIREHWLEDPAQVSEGVSPGEVLRVNASCPPGASVMERVDTSSVPQEGLNVLNLINQEFSVSALTNDLRMGVASFRAVKATEVVEASQSISSMFAGMAKQIEANYLVPMLTKAWKTLAQNMSNLSEEHLKSLLGARRADELKNMSNEDLFVETVQGIKFNVFGISSTLNKQKDFAKFQGLLQTVGSSPVLLEEFTKEYSFGKLLGEIMMSLGINPEKLEEQEEAPEIPEEPETPDQEDLLEANQGLPDMASQQGLPQESQDEVQSNIPRTEFPGSRALQV